MIGLSGVVPLSRTKLIPDSRCRSSNWMGPTVRGAASSPPLDGTVRAKLAESVRPRPNPNATRKPRELIRPLSSPPIESATTTLSSPTRSSA